MSQTAILKNWAAKSRAALHRFWQALKAMDHALYDYMNDCITHLEEKMKRYETAGSGQILAEKP